MTARRSDVTILVLLGSLRKQSVNRQLVEVATSSAPPDVHLEHFDRLDEIPFYNEDLDTDPAVEPVAALRRAADRADGALIVTPEYNGSVPGVLKNAIDWLSRPYGRGPLRDKPTAVIGASLGRFGGVWAHDETRKCLDIAGASVASSIALSVPTANLGGRHPCENHELVTQLGDVVRRLVDRTRARAG